MCRRCEGCLPPFRLSIFTVCDLSCHWPLLPALAGVRSWHLANAFWHLANAKCQGRSGVRGRNVKSGERMINLHQFFNEIFIEMIVLNTTQIRHNNSRLQFTAFPESAPTLSHEDRRSAEDLSGVGSD